jgi:Phosphotransferase enzyme family
MLGSGTQKLEWQELPEHVRGAVEDFLGAPIVSSETQPGGFSPGVAAKVRTNLGKTAFVKSVSSALSAFGADANRREIVHTRALQCNPRVPRLLHSFEQDGWVTLISEIVQGKHPDLPWRDDELALVLSEIVELSASLTPCPHPELFGLMAERDLGVFSGWANLAGESQALGELRDSWIEKNLGALVRLEADWPRAARGGSLIHTDLRADQILIAKERAVFLDWPHARIGAPWIDLLFMCPSIVLQGGPDMATLIQRSPLGRVPRSELLPMATALAGFFVWNSLQPAPPRLVTLRSFQRRQGDVVLGWLRGQGV